MSSSSSSAVDRLPDRYMSNKKNPCVFLDLTISGTPVKRIVIELFAHKLPKTAENFRQLCTGDNETGIGKTTSHYKGTVFSRIYSGYFAQVGHFPNQKGKSTYGRLFADEEFKPKHIDCGMLTVHRYITGFNFLLFLARPFPELDGSHAVFGKVIDGMETFEKIDKLGTADGIPSGEVKITNCGEISEEDKKSYVNVMESDKGKKRKIEKRVDPPYNHVSEFFTSKRKYSKRYSDYSGYTSYSASMFYSSLLEKIRDWGKEVPEVVMARIRDLAGIPEDVVEIREDIRDFHGIPEDVKNDVMVKNRDSPIEIPEDKKSNVTESDEGKKEKTGKRAISSDDESSDGRVKKKQHASTVRDSSSELSAEEIAEEIYTKLMLQLPPISKVAEYKKNNDKGKMEENESSDERQHYWSTKPRNLVLESYSSKGKYFSLSKLPDSDSEFPSYRFVNKEDENEMGNYDSDSEYYNRKRMDPEVALYSKSSISYSSD